MRFGVFKNLIAEAVFYEFGESLAWNRADARARGSERDDEFSVFVHDAEWPDGTVEGFIFGLQDAAFVRVKKRAGNFFFGVVGAVIVFKNKAVRILQIARIPPLVHILSRTSILFLARNGCKLPHHAVFVRLAQFFHDFGWEKRRFPETLPAEGAAELAGGAGFARKNSR